MTCLTLSRTLTPMSNRPRNGEEEQEPTKEELESLDIHNHECGNCGGSYTCTLAFCAEPYLCAECFLTEGESSD